MLTQAGRQDDGSAVAIKGECRQQSDAINFASCGEGDVGIGCCAFKNASQRRSSWWKQKWDSVKVAQLCWW